MGGVPGGGGGGGVAVGTLVSSTALDMNKHPVRTYGVTEARSRLEVYTIGLGREGFSPTIRLDFKFEMTSFVNNSVVEGTNDFGGSYGRNLSQSVFCNARIEFDGTTGTPLAVTSQGHGGTNLATQYGTMFNSTSSVPMNGSPMTYAGKSYGRWVSAQLRWPVWEISGANFRFFGQNWIRLIKVSGP